MRFKLVRVLGIIASCTIGLAPGCGDDGTIDAVREAFDKYATARANQDADTMISCIDPENFKHDDYLCQTALSGSKSQVMRLSPYERLQVTILRGSMKPAELKELDGRKLYKLTVQKRWEDAGQSDVELSLGDVKLSMPRATGELLRNGHSTGVKLEMVAADGKWLINKDSFDRVMDNLIKDIAQMGRTTDDDVIIHIASGVIGREQHKGMWDEPPK